MSKKRVYIAHPYGGKEENKQAVAKIIKELLKEHDDIVPVSPIHALGFMYNEMSYIEGMLACLTLLNSCDELWLCSDWEISRGCCMEFGYAFAKGDCL
jgi:nucleoside 2-deoxyribosyltransferase